ncbi:MAG: glycosyltransferase [Verrucomicrobia bacterium]|nr:glycosyltransferase [Verrucomicrobiota bacterium]
MSHASRREPDRIRTPFSHELGGSGGEEARREGAEAVQFEAQGSTSEAPRAEPWITAVVSTYRAERFLRGCLADLEAQTVADRLEIVVVDSGSPENEHAIVREFQARYANVVYLRTEQRETVYGAWNRAIRVARGRYLTNANTDDRHRTDALERLARALDAHPEAAVAYGDCAITRTENATLADAPITGYFRWPEFDRMKLFRTCYLGSQPLWRRALHERFGDFDPTLVSAGDYEFWLRIARAEIFVHVPEVLGLYLESPGSIEHRHREQASEEARRVRDRHWAPHRGICPWGNGSYLARQFSRWLNASWIEKLLGQA